MDHRSAAMPAPALGPSKLDLRRAKNIGASEAPALFSLDWDPSDEFRPFETRLQLWLRKRGVIPPKDIAGERVFWGQHLEPGIGNGIAAMHGWTLRKGQYLIHPNVKGMAASPDFFASESPDRGLESPTLIQVKCVDRYEYNRWRDVVEPGVMIWSRGEWIPAEKQPPFRVKLQVQHELACADEFAFGVIAVLVGGNSLKVEDEHSRG